MRVTQINLEKDEVPKDGYVYACFREKVLFQKRDLELDKYILNNQAMLLELHIFDAQQEYRLIRCETGDFIEAVVNDEEAGVEKKVEIVQVEGGFASVMECLKVVNYIDYDNNGMLSISNYRFAPTERGR